jgi:hypothetical protein
MVSEQRGALSSPGRRRVAVIGAGVSGLVAAKCLLPRYVLGRLYDHQLTRLVERMPYRLRTFLFSRLLLFEYRRIGVTPPFNCKRGDCH